MKLKKIIGLMLFLLVFLGIVAPAGASQMGIKYTMIEADETCPYIIIIDKGGARYDAYKSSVPFWYVSDDKALIIREDGLIKQYTYSGGSKKWVHQNTQNRKAGDVIVQSLELSKITDYTYPVNGEPLRNHNIKPYPPMVKKEELATDRIKQAAAAMGLDMLGIATGESVNGIISDLKLKNSYTYQEITYPVTWTSSNPSIISHDGKVTRPSFSQGDQTVTLTATIMQEGVSAERTFKVTVLCITETDLDKAIYLASSLTNSHLGIDDLNNVTDNLNPISSISDGGIAYPVTWKSSNPQVLADNGLVRRPSYEDGDAEVTFTGTVKVGEATYSKAFKLTIKRLDETEENQNIRIANSLPEDVLGLGSQTATAIVENLSLATKYNGKTLTWTSSHPEIISETGEVNRPAKDTYVTLTATVGNTPKATKSFVVKVLGREMTEAEILAAMAELFSLDTIKTTEDLSQITQDFKVDTQVSFQGTTIPVTWSFDNTGLTINPDGTVIVTRPAFGEEQIQGTLRATLTLGAETKTIDFPLTILPVSKSELEGREKAERLINSLTRDAFVLNEGESLVTIQSDFKVRSIWDGETITWTSNDPDVVLGEETDGLIDVSITRPTDADKEVVLTASYMGVTREFPFVILKEGNSNYEETDEAKAHRIMETFPLSLLGLDGDKDNFYLTKNLLLPPTIKDGQDEYPLTYSSSTPEVLSNTGEITRPSFTEGDKKAILKVTIDVNGYVYSKDLSFMVVKLPETDEEKAVRLSQNLRVKEQITFSGTDDVTIVTSNMNFKPTTNTGEAVTYQSLSPNVTDSGIVTRPVNSEIAVIRATVNINGMSASKDLKVYLEKADFVPESDAQRAIRIRDSLTEFELGLADGDTVKAVTQDLNLKTSVRDMGEDFPLTWESSNPEIISETGKVTRPSYSQGKQTVILRATVTVNNETQSKEYAVTVMPQAPTDSELAEMLKDMLTSKWLGIKRGEGPLGITQDLNLETTIEGYPIVYASSNTNYVDVATGKVTRPKYDEDDKEVIIEARVNVNGTLSSPKTFNLKVLKEVAPQIPTTLEIYGFNIENGTQLMQILATEDQVTHFYDAVVLDQNGNPIDTEDITFTLATDSFNENGLTLTVSGKRAAVTATKNLIIDNIQPSEVPLVDVNLSYATLTATSGSLSKSINITIEKEIVPPVAEGAVLLEKTFEAQDLFLGKYGELPEDENLPYKTLINYGAFQLLFLTDVPLVYNTNTDKLTFKDNGTNLRAKVKIYRASGTDWVLISSTTDNIPEVMEISVDKNYNSIEYLNYDLYSLAGTKLLNQSIGEIKATALPDLPTLNGYNYYHIFGIYDSDYVIALLKNQVHINGNELIGINSGDVVFYSLVGNKWVRNSSDGFYERFYSSKVAFLENLMYSNYAIMDHDVVVFEANSDTIIKGKPNFLTHLLRFVNPNYKRIYFDNPFSGLIALEYTGNTPYEKDGALYFNSKEKIKEYKFVNGDWTVSRVIDAEVGLRYDMVDALSSLRYSDETIYSQSGETIFSGGINDNVIFYYVDTTNKLAGLFEPPQKSGYDYRTVISIGAEKKAIYSQQPLTIDAIYLVSLYNQEVEIYNFYGGEWVFEAKRSLLRWLEPNKVESNALAVNEFTEETPLGTVDYLWSDYDLKDLNTDEIISPAKDGSVFLSSGYYLPEEEDLTTPYYMYMLDGMGGYYVQRFSQPPSRLNEAIYAGTNNIKTKILLNRFGIWKEVFAATYYDKSSQIGEIAPTASVKPEENGHYGMNFTFMPYDAEVDRTPPVIEAIYVYRKMVYVVGSDDTALHTVPYGFQFLSEVTLPVELKGLNRNNQEISIPKGEVIPVGTEIFKSNGYQSIDIPVRIKITLRDSYNNETSQIVDITEDNTVLYGTVSQEIQDMLDAEKEEEDVDTYPPVITGIYIYRGEVYILGYDAKELHPVPYGWKFLEETVLTSDVMTEDKNGVALNFPAGFPIPAGTEIYKKTNGQEVVIGSTIEVILRDNAFNETRKTVYVDEDNKVLWGTVTPYIQYLLDRERNKQDDTTEEIDKNPPIITAIYTYKGKVYVMGYDDKQLALRAYGFKWLEDSTLDYNLEGEDEQGNPVSIPAGATIPAGTEIFSALNNQYIKYNTLMEITLKDAAGNKTKRRIYFNEDNAVYYGEVPEGIQRLIDEANGNYPAPPQGEEDKTPPIITRVFVENGILYIEGYDAGVGLHDRPYGFKVMVDTVISSDFIGLDRNDNPVNIPAGQIIPQYTEIYKLVSYQEVMIPMVIEVSLRDRNFNEARLLINVDKDNTEYYRDDKRNPGKGDDGLDDDEGKGDDSDNGGNPDDENGSETENPNDGIIDDGDGGKDEDKGKEDENEDSGHPPKTDTPTHNEPIMTDKGGLIITPPSEWDDSNWDRDTRYQVVLIDKETKTLVYSISLESLQKVQIPRLEDSTTYIVQESIVRLDKILDSRRYEVTTADTTSPVITNMWVEGNKLYVTAYDKGGLADAPYIFTIVGSPKEGTPQKENYKIVTNRDIVTVTVIDKAGNSTSVTVPIIVGNLQTNVNFNSPEVLYTNITYDKDVWVKELAKKYGISGDLELLATDNLLFNGNDVTLIAQGRSVISLRDRITGKQYDILVHAQDSGKSNRTIVVQRRSETNFAYVFKNTLQNLFGTYRDIEWKVVNSGIIEKKDNLVYAKANGVGIIEVSQNGKKVRFYVVVTDDIEKTQSLYAIGNETVPYTVMLNSKITLGDYLDIQTENPDPLAYRKYLIVETDDKGLKVTDDIITFTEKGVKRLSILNVVDDSLFPITIEAIEIEKKAQVYIDIQGHWAYEQIMELANKGILWKMDDFRYKPNNNITIKEFLTMLNRFKMMHMPDLDKDTKYKKEIPLTNKDFTYYSCQNILMSITEDEMYEIFGDDVIFNRSITRKEAVQVLSRTLLRNEYHNTEGNKVYSDVDYSEDWVADLEHIGSMDIVVGYPDGTFRPDDNITRAEATSIILNLYRFFGLN